MADSRSQQVPSYTPSAPQIGQIPTPLDLDAAEAI